MYHIKFLISSLTTRDFPRDSAHFHKYSVASLSNGTPRNEMAQAEATIALNSAQLRATEFRLETLVNHRQ